MRTHAARNLIGRSTRNSDDNAVEADELEPIARQVSFAGASRAESALRMTMGGPTESPMMVPAHPSRCASSRSIASTTSAIPMHRARCIG
jgi:hypothetical protein